MLNQRIRGGWDRLMRPVGQGLARVGFTANSLTVTGMVLHGVVAWLILDGRLMAAGLVAIPIAFFDSFDGAVAKANGSTTKFGALLDSTTDRLSDALYLLPVAWLYAVSPDIAERDEPWVAVVALGALVAQFLVPYVKARAESLGFECNVGIAERAERLIITIAGLILDLVPIAVSVLLVLSTITFLQRLLHTRNQVPSET